MSLLQKASIITTPTAYAEDYLYSIKPAYALGSELVTQFDGVADGTDVATLTGWFGYGTATSRNVVDEKLVVVTSAGNQGARFSATTTVGTKYLFKATATGDLGSSGIYISSGSLNLNLDTSVGNIEVTFTAALTSTNLFFRASNNNAGTTTYSNISFKEVTDADFDFDRNSTGTRVNEDYLIEDVPYNLFNYSEQLDNAYWVSNGGTRTANQVIAPDGTLTADKFLFNAFASGVYTSAFPAGTYTMSIFIKPESGDGLIRVGMGLNNSQLNTTNLSITNQGTGVGRISSAANGFYRFVTTFTTTSSTAANIYNLNTNTVIAYIWGVQIVKGDQPKDYLKTTDRLDIPRIDYTNGEPSILLEPQSTNLCTHSVDFATGVSSGSLNLGNNSTLTYVSNVQAPDGTMGVYRLQNPAQGSTYLSFYNGNSKNVSVYVKAVDVNKDNQFTLFKSGGSPNVSDVFSATSNWQRYNLEYADAGNITGINNEGDLYASDVYIWGAQVERTNSYATSLIHTSGSAVTRSADAANNAGNSDLFNDSEGVLYCQTAAPSTTGSADYISISDGTNNERVIISAHNVLNTIRVFIKSGGSFYSTIDFVASNITEFQKIAFSYKSGQTKLYANGSLVGTSSDSFSLSSISNLQFANGNTTSNPYLGKTKMVAVFKEALSDTELAKLTGYNNHELYMNYYNRLSYLGLAEEYNVESDINNYIL